MQDVDSVTEDTADVTWRCGTKQSLSIMSNGTDTEVTEHRNRQKPPAIIMDSWEDPHVGDEGIGMCCNGEVQGNERTAEEDGECDADSGCSSSLLSPPPGPLFINVDDSLQFPVKFPVSPNSPLQEDEFRIERAELIRSSSLKAAKTPPGTPGRKKVVRFADAMGLDLESVRHILQADGPPKVPTRVMESFRDQELPEVNTSDILALETPGKYLTPTFPHPGASFGFLDRVHERKVCLENCMITDRTIAITVRVANIGFHKSVFVKYTLDNWATNFNTRATYVLGSCDGPTDRFTSSICVPSDFPDGSTVEFCIQYVVNDQSYWDSNYGPNYQIVCCASQYSGGMDPTMFHF